MEQINGLLSPEPACVPEECFDQDDGGLFVLSLAILSTVQLELHVCEVYLTQELKQNRTEISCHKSRALTFSFWKRTVAM